MNLPEINLEEAYITTNRIRLHTVMAGPQDGRPVILLHGFPEYWRGWIRQIPALAEAGYRVIIPDQRGYNLSDKPKGIKAYRIEQLVQDITGLMEALGHERVHLVGHDWGGVVAWALAAWHPERLHNVCILNAPHPSAMRKFVTRDLEQIGRSWYAMMFQLPWIPEAGMRANDWRGAARVLRGSGKVHTFTNADIAGYKKAWSQPGAITAMVNWYRAALRYRPPTSKPMRVSKPALILWGMKDVALTSRLAEASMEYCEDGRLEFCPDATHWVQHEEADKVNSHLLEFLSG
jgi:pimeloyl-ACP methyl ester carboxylesterase